ncbi:putative LSU ribosomal protein L14P, partial [Cardiosporidium cionae]
MAATAFCPLFHLSRPFLGIWKNTILRCADNTGIIKACVIGIGKNHWGTGKVGDRVRLAIRDKTIDCTAPKLPYGIVVRRKKETRRKDGSHLKFDENAFIQIAGNKAKGTQIRGPVP